MSTLLRRGVPLLATLLLGAAAARAWLVPDPEVEVVTRVDTIPSRALEDSVEELELTANGLRARLEDIEHRPPRVIYRTDTLVAAPDTVLRLVRVRDGELVYAPLIRRDSLWAPELHTGIQVGDCDEGWSIQGGSVLCDRARLGHAYLFGGADMAGPMAGVWWQPAYRSSWRLEAGWRGDRWYLGARWGFQIF